MGWKGTVRSLQAAARAADREARRRQRELERQAKAQEKMEALEQAAYEVKVYENRIELLLSVHKQKGSWIDWRALASTPQPSKPEPSYDRQCAARAAESLYSPGFFHRVFKLEQKKRAELASAVEQAIRADAEDHKAALDLWRAQHADWQERTALARKILSGDAEARLGVIAAIDPFCDIAELGSHISFAARRDGSIEATLHTHGTDVIPSETKSLLSSGRLSVKKMPKGRFNELYQDYVCSCVLRVANELFSILPDELVFVTAQDDLLNTATGHLEEVPILSVAVSRATLGGLNLDAIDPSDSMSNFVHRMAFKKTSGFSAVQKVELAELASA